MHLKMLAINTYLLDKVWGFIFDNKKMARVSSRKGSRKGSKKTSKRMQRIPTACSSIKGKRACNMSVGCVSKKAPGRKTRICVRAKGTAKAGVGSVGMMM